MSAPPAPAAPAPPAVDIERLIARDKRAIGRAISLCEDARPQAAAARAAVVAALAGHPRRRCALLVGLTGPPASGKSSLIAELAVRLVAERPAAAVAVLAVDPSSPRSGGALLGDRVRVRFPPGDDRLFFRSQASELELGGLGRHTFSVCRLLQHLFDCVLVETVGVGQSEVDVHRLVDRTYLVLPPLWGDAVQLMKAGILEIPDAIVLSKQDLAARVGDADRPDPAAGAATLTVALAAAGRAIDVHGVSAHTGSGLAALVAELSARFRSEDGDRGESGGRPPGGPLDGREGYFFGRWVQAEFGRHGLAALEANGSDPDRFAREAGGFDGAVAAFPTSYRRWLSD